MTCPLPPRPPRPVSRCHPSVDQCARGPARVPETIFVKTHRGSSNLHPSLLRRGKGVLRRGATSRCSKGIENWSWEVCGRKGREVGCNAEGASWDRPPKIIGRCGKGAEPGWPARSCKALLCVSSCPKCGLKSWIATQASVLGVICQKVIRSDYLLLRVLRLVFFFLI